MTRYISIAAITAAAAACATASTGATAHQQGCTLAPGDSVYLRRGPVFRECAVEQPAVATDRSAHPDLNISSPPPGGQACYVAEMEFVVDELGTPETETATVVRTNNQEFADASLAVLSRWRYRPATLHGYPVRQIVRETQKMSVVLVRVPAGQTPRPPVRGPVC